MKSQLQDLMSGLMVSLYSFRVSCDKRGLNMDYLPALRVRLTDPLVKHGSEGVPQLIGLMDEYDIIKDDYDNILELTKWPNSKDPLANIDSKVNGLLVLYLSPPFGIHFLSFQVFFVVVHIIRSKSDGVGFCLKFTDCHVYDIARMLPYK